MKCLMGCKAPRPGRVYDLKLDGYRAQALRDAGEVRLLSRSGLDLTKRFPIAVQALKEAISHHTVIDGEIVGFDGDGRPSFNALPASIRLSSSCLRHHH
jgi:bifunctional non-homologous end joining protein LigD